MTALEKNQGDRPPSQLGSWFFKVSIIFLAVGIVLAVVIVVEKSHHTTRASYSISGGSGSSTVNTKPTNETPSSSTANATSNAPDTKNVTNTVNTTFNSTFNATAAVHVTSNATNASVSSTPYTLGSVQGVGYYHCSADSNLKKATDIVLLHGASFTKEIWKTTGILDLLCAIPQFSTTALDLPINDGHVDLQNILNGLQSQALVTLPLTLVTPSASSWSVTDWMMQASSDGSAPLYFDTWIPVAPVALTQASDRQIVSTLHPVNHAPIKVLAIYGDHDNGGASLSQRLESLVNATLTKIPGGHACYRQSPGPFVDVIAKFFGLK